MDLVKEMKDMYGLSLYEGDEIIYAMGGLGNSDLIHGLIISIGTDRNDNTVAKVKELSKGSISTRTSKDILKLNPYIMQNPELFV